MRKTTNNENSRIRCAVLDDEFAKLVDEFLQKPKILNKKDGLNNDSKENDEIKCIESDSIEQYNSQSAYDQLMNMVGLEDVKKAIARQLSYHRLMRERSRRGFPVPKRLLHMIFTGNPGCGKTTVARLVACIYREAGIISSDRFIETSRAQLVGKFIGDTEANTNAVLEDARGGVLFIDEIYSLVEDRDSKRDYGIKVIDTLMPVLSSTDSDVMVIGAGYTERINNFISSNPGLASRFPMVLNFPDFTLAQLMEIGINTLVNYGFQLQNEAKMQMSKILNRASRMQDFGNARTVMTMIENHIIPNMGNRLEVICKPFEEFTTDELSIVLPEDLPSFEDLFPLSQDKRRVGFISVKNA